MAVYRSSTWQIIVTPRLQELQLFRLQQESKNIVPAINERENPSKKSASEKRKLTPDSTEEQAPAKHQKTIAQNLNKKVQNDISQARQRVEPSESVKSDGNIAERASNQEKKDKSSKTVPFDDQCTAFISNLNLQTTADDLQSFFADVGGVIAIRILKDKFTRKSRGLAYVDFSDDAHLAAALVKNKQIFMGKKLSILKSNPQQGRKQVAGPSVRSEHGGEVKRADDNAANADKRDAVKGSKEIEPQSPSSRRGDVQLKGRNTFAVPRNVKPLGWSSQSKMQPDAANEQEDENPKSNDDFRKMFVKS